MWCGDARMRVDLAMTVVPMLTRRLLRIKLPATYLSMSEWKLRRLIAGRDHSVRSEPARRTVPGRRV